MWRWASPWDSSFHRFHPSSLPGRRSVQRGTSTAAHRRTPTRPRDTMQGAELLVLHEKRNVQGSVPSAVTHTASEIEIGAAGNAAHFGY